MIPSASYSQATKGVIISAILMVCAPLSPFLFLMVHDLLVNEMVGDHTLAGIFLLGVVAGVLLFVGALCGLICFSFRLKNEARARAAMRIRPRDVSSSQVRAEVKDPI